MIRINLLPVPKARKSEALIAQSVMGLIILALVAIGCYFVAASKQAEIAQLNKQIQEKQRDINDLKAKVGEVEKFKRQAQVLEEQLGVIRSLEKGRSGPVKMMDELTDLTPRRLWIASFKESGKRVTIDGTAESGPVIADFLENIKSSKYFSNPTLSLVQSQETDGLKLHKFTITFGVKYDI
ncbi:MAG: PilN domain-containing protein [Deltaproteobacteria bacterium]|nr:PilN domain-containing protein [Deltaproteobacteria bacterium]